MAAQNEDTIPLLSMTDDNEEVQFRPPPYPRPAASPQPYGQMPPAAHYHQPPAQTNSQQSSNNTVVVTGPTPQPPTVRVTRPARKPSQNVLVLSLVLFALCSLTCNIWSLCLLIPGLIAAVVGFNYRHSPKPNKRQTGRGLTGLSLCCSLTALITFLVGVLCLILFLGIYFGLLQKRLQAYFSCTPTPDCYTDYSSCDEYKNCPQVCSSSSSHYCFY